MVLFKIPLKVCKAFFTCDLVTESSIETKTYTEWCSVIKITRGALAQNVVKNSSRSRNKPIFGSSFEKASAAI